MGIVEISDGLGSRRIQVDDLQGIVRIDCSDGVPTLVVPEGSEVDHEAAGGASDDPGLGRRVRR